MALAYLNIFIAAINVSIASMYNSEWAWLNWGAATLCFGIGIIVAIDSR